MIYLNPAFQQRWYQKDGMIYKLTEEVLDLFQISEIATQLLAQYCLTEQLIFIQKASSET